GRRFEEISATTGAVADVVADQVRDHGRVARVVLGNARLDFADEVGAEIRGLRVDPAAELSEERDERRAKSEPDDRERSLLRMIEPTVRDEHDEDADQRETNDEDPGDRSATQRDAERIGDAVLRRRGGSEIRLHGD